MNRPVPLFDLARAERRIAADLDARWRRVRSATAFVQGEEVALFERAFAGAVGAAATVGVANGTDALELAVRALGVGPGDEVVVPAFTFIATGSAVVLAGGTPVFADVDPDTLNLDLASAAERVGERTVGLIGVHLYGCPFDVEGARELCRRHGLWLIEDAAQAHGARLGGRPVGALGDLATWSFYPSKNLGAFGDGGAVTGPDAERLAAVRRLANHGAVGRYEHAEIGRNSRLDALQAAVLNCRLELLAEDNERRREIAAGYRARLAEAGELRFLAEPEDAVCVYHQMTVRVPRREALQSHLAARGIGSAVHYPRPLHRQAAFAGRPAPSLPVAEAAAADVLSLPMFPELSEAEVETTCDAIRDFFGATG